MAYANPDGSGGRQRANENAAKNGTKLTVRLSKPQTTVDHLLLAFPPIAKPLLRFYSETSYTLRGRLIFIGLWRAILLIFSD